MKKKVVKSLAVLVMGSSLLGFGLGVLDNSMRTLGVSTVYAIDDITSKETNNQNQEDNNQNQEQGSNFGFDTNRTNEIPNKETGTIGDGLRGIKVVDENSLKETKANSGWIFWLSGIVISTIILVTWAAIGIISVLDLLYLFVPVVRPYLYTAGTDGTGASTGMGGMGYGGMMGGAQPAKSGSMLGLQWISDEAVQVSAMLGGSAQATGHAVGGMGYGGMGMGMGMQNDATQKRGGKVVIVTYLRKRVVALVVFGIACVLLFTSAFTDFGMNIGGMLLQFLSFLAEKMNLIKF